jgi:hypothetical protein
MRLLKLIIYVSALLLGGTILTAQQKNSPLTNNDVVKMVKAGLPEATIVDAIATSDPQFDLSSAGLQALSQAGVSSKVVRAMLAAESKKKEAAPPVADNTPAPAASPDISSGPSSQPGMPDMSQMMAQMPPAARGQMEAAMARRGTGRPGMGGPPAGPSVPSSSRPGVPVSLDSPLYTSFALLKAHSAYRMVMTMESTDPRVAQMAAQGMGFSPGELTVQGGTRQFVMHMRMPATDVKGTIDDWEIRSVVRDGRAARLITSPAVPRYLKEAEEKLAMQLAILDRQAAMSIAHAAAEGPMGAIGAGMEAAQVALAHVEAPRLMKKARDMFSWQCQAAPKSSGEGSSQSTTQLTDLHPIGDQVVNGQTAAAYEFYAYDNEKTQGTVHLMVAKDTGLPLRLEMGNPQAGQTMKMDYSELTQPVSIEIPSCMGGAQ